MKRGDRECREDTDPGDPYDGHGDYHRDARNEDAAGYDLAPLVSENRAATAVVWPLLRAVAVGFGFLVAYRALVWVERNVHGELGFAGIAVLLGIIAAGGYSGVTRLACCFTACESGGRPP